MTTTTAADRRTVLHACVDAYFDGIIRKDMSAVPWHRDVVFRGPLAPGYPEPMTGRSTVLDWFNGLYGALGSVSVIDRYIDEQGRAIAARADVGLATGGTLRVVDRFIVDDAGLIVEQENHYDPRPAMDGAPGAMSAPERDLVLDLLISSQRQLLAAVVRLTPDQWRFAPGGERWSIAQCAEHLSLTEDGLLGIVRGQILASAPAPDKVSSARARDGVVVAAMRDRSQRSKTFDFLEPRTIAPTPADFVATFLHKRHQTMQYVRETREALHYHFAPLGPLGDLDAYQWLLLLASHTERHERQIEEIKQSAGFPRSR